MGRCYKNRRFTSLMSVSTQSKNSNTKYQSCLDSNNKIRMIGYRNKLEDCRKYLPAPTKPKVEVEVKCISSKVKLLYAAFGLDQASQPVCDDEEVKSEVVYA